MTDLLKKEKINYANNLLYAVKLLSKDLTFWVNLIPAIVLTLEVMLLKRPILLLSIGGIFAILNWGVVICLFYEAIKRKH